MTQSTDSQETTHVPRFRDAYQSLLGEIRAVPPSALTPIIVDIPTAVTTALGALPEIRALRSRVVSEMPQLDVARFDKLEAYTLALGHAHALYMAASAPQESLDQIAEAATTLRETLLSDALALAQRNLLDGQRLEGLKGPHGFRNLAFDLFALAAMMRDNWSTISGKSATQLTELDQAETLADRILTTVGQREQGPAVVAASAEIRQRAFSLFVSAYDHARRAISFLRWNEEDVDKIAPSLYAGRTTGKRKNSDTPAARPVTPPEAAPGAPEAPKPSTPATSNGGATSASVGMPQSEPFLNR
ncbi:MAG TPA: hypothetical protein VK550_33305 [Polyangiaceae bacterium]|jgi:hypothetical protein|nr:hypothetical protein [Polyangiaceae bacterium]